MKIVPLGERILVEKSEQQSEEKTVRGIILPSDDKPLKYGTVVAISSDIKECPLQIGSKVIYKDYSGKDVELDGKEYSILPLKDVEAVLKEQ